MTLIDTLLMETGLFHDYFGNFSMQGKRYYFRVEGSMRGEIEMNTGKLGRLKFPFWVEEITPSS